MKKLMLLGAAVAMISVTACKKDYDCECTTTDSSGAMADVVSTSTMNGKKNDVKDACEGANVSVGTISTSCKIK